jgi:hypothetical protein
MWLIIRNIYLKYEVDPLRNKVTVKILFLQENSKFKGDKSLKNGARVINLVA